MPELKSAWARESAENKEKVIAQFKVPVVNNRQLTAYEAEIQYEDGGYESEITAKTQNSEHTYAFSAETEFDANATVNSIEILTSTDKPRQLPILKTSMQGNHHSNVSASQPQSYRLLDKLTNALKSKIMTRLI